MSCLARQVPTVAVRGGIEAGCDLIAQPVGQGNQEKRKNEH